MFWFLSLFCFFRDTSSAREKEKKHGNIGKPRPLRRARLARVRGDALRDDLLGRDLPLVPEGGREREWPLTAFLGSSAAAS